MKQKLTLLIMLLFSITNFYSQISCGFDNLLSVAYADSLSKRTLDTTRFHLRQKVAQIRQNNNPNAKTQQNNYVIPVVFHLVGSNASSLTDAQVTAQLNLLNAAFSNSLGSTYSSADDVQVKFCLAQTLPNGQPWTNVASINSNLYTGSTAGITRCTTSVADAIAYNHNMESTATNGQQSLKNFASYWNFDNTKYLNIWVVERISFMQAPYVNSVAGYATFPNLVTNFDGIVMRLGAFGINTSFSDSYTSQGTILAHEAGHYLGVFHTFQGGCAGTTTTTCYNSGDECCDTPPVLAANQNSCSVLSATPPNSCSESPDLPDMFENHMDYQYDNSGNCRNTFTNDQADRIHSTIQLYRPNLVSYTNHIFTGLTNVGGCQANAINPDFITNLPNASKQFCTGQSVGFLTGSSAATYTWTFSGATPSVAIGTYSPTGITYSATGVYSVSLNITDGTGNSYSSVMQVFVSSCNSLSSNRANWYFGNYASVSFSTGIATAQTPSAMRTMEASACISNASGNLLFYTNGQSVYNASHTAVTNGNGTLNGSNNSLMLGQVSAAQGVVIVPRPSNSNKYYIFTTSDVPTTGSFPSNISNGISQYEVDMTTSAGVVTSTIPVHPTDNYATNEPIIAIPHCNGTNYWLLVKPKNNNQNGLPNAGPLSTINQYIACYSVTSSGISNTPVLSPSSPYVPSFTFALGNDGMGQIAVSPDKSMIAISALNSGSIYLYYFDCSSGKTNYVSTLSNISPYGFAFSPNSKVLYTAGNNNTILQYDLSNISICNSNPPAVTIFTDVIDPANSSFRLAPDGRIYLSHFNANFLSVINFPNNLNTTGISNECGFNLGGIPLFVTNTYGSDLPNDINSQSGQTADDFSYCVSNCGQAKFANLGCGTTFAWNFGDGYTISGTNTVIPAGTNGGTTSGNYEYPAHTYTTTGNYTITLSIDGRTAITHTISILPPPTPTITGPVNICPTNTTSPSYYYAPAGYSYTWTATNASPSSGNTDEFVTTWMAFPATLTLTIANLSNGCTATSSVSINVYSTVSVTATSSTICAGSPTTLTASGSSSYSWNTGATTSSISVTPSTTTVYTVTGTSGSCVSTKTIQVTVYPTPTISVTNPTICVGTSTSAVASSAHTYSWSTGVTTNYNFVTPTVTTTYTVIGTNTLTGCSSTKIATVTVNPLPSGTLTPNGSISLCGSQTITVNAISSADPNSSYNWTYNNNPTSIGTGQSINVSLSGDYKLVITNTLTGCSKNFVTPVYIAPTNVCNQCLVPNGDFEYYANLSNNFDNIVDAPFWNNPTSGTSDYYNTASTAMTTIPNNGATINTPDHTGNVTQGYAGFLSYESYNTDGREYIQTPLNCALEPNQLYNVSMWARAASELRYITNNIGIRLSTSAITGGYNLFGHTPQLNFTAVVPANSWSQLTGTVTGNNETHITIGNFYDDAAITTTVINVGASGAAYYFIDDVSIVPIAPSFTASTSSCITSGSAVTLTLSGSPGYYLTNGVTTQTLNAATGTLVVSPTVTTTYTITPKLVCNKCNVFSTITISVSPNVTVTASSSSICAGSSSTLTATGATTYSWSTSATTHTIAVTPTATTIYTVTATANSCAITKTVNVTVTPNPTVAVNNATICSGTSTVLTATGATTYSWNTGATTNTISVSPTVTTIYTVTGTSSSCTNIKTVTVTVKATPTVAVNNTSVCIGSSTVVTASGATSYSWNTGATTHTISVSPTVTTVYTVTGTTNGCTNTKTLSVTPIALPVLTITPTSTSICSGKSTTLTASGANTYTWNPSVITTSVAVISPTSTTIYTVTGKNTTTGCTNTKTVSVTVNPNPTVTAVANPTSICVGQTATLTAGGATTYSWSTTSTNTIINVAPSITTTYTAYGFYTTGCSSTKTVSVIVGAVTPTITASSSSVNVCGGGSATLTATGASNYTWSPISVYTSTAAITPTAAIVYTLSGSSGAGCNTATTTLLVNPVISTLCCSAANSSITTSTITAGAYAVSGTVIDVSGVITFTGNTSFTGYTFRMKPNTQLRVVGEKTLTLTNCKLYSCSELWDGIYLIGSNNDVHGHLVLNNTTVEDMYNGIVVEGNNWPVLVPNTGLLISSTASTLNKNYISMQFRNIDGTVAGPGGLTYTTTPYPFSMITTTISSYSTTTSPGSTLKPSSTYTYAYNNITNGTMGGTAPYLNFPRAYTGINLNNLRYITPLIIGDRANASNTNTFDNLDFGVNATNAQLEAYNNYFKNITGSAKQGDVTTFPTQYYATGPDEIGIAIAVTNTTSNTFDIKVGNNTVLPSGGNPFPRGNKFEDCNQGIKAINCKNVRAFANTFTATTTSIPVVTTTGSPPYLLLQTNPNSYYYYGAQSAIFASGVSDNMEASYNYIQNHSNGIYSNYTSNSVGTSVRCYTNNIAASSSTGYCLQAIQVDQSGGFTTAAAAIIGNDIRDVYRGIITNTVKNYLTIAQNSIRVEDMAKTLNYSASSPRTGISISGCDYGLVLGNNVTSNAITIPSTPTNANYLTGISVNASPNSKVECNNTNRLGRDFVFQGACGASSWKANTMQDSYRGLEMRLSAVIGQQGAISGAPNLSANTWTTVTEETYVFATNPNSTSPLFILNNVAGNPKTLPTANYPTASSSRYQTGFSNGLQVTTGTSYTCNGGYAQRMANTNSDENNNSGGSHQKIANTSTDSLTAYVNLATADENSYEVFADEMQYQNKQLVYKLIEQDSINPATGSILNDFYADNQTTAIGKLSEAEKAIGNYDIMGALQANNAAPVSSMVEQKYQKANELTLKYMADFNYAFTDAEKNELYSMANECPAKGTYVSSSRNLVNVILRTVVVYNDNCDEEANASRKAQPKVVEVVNPTSFNLFPNPNNGTMVLDYNLGNYTDAKVNVFDITGKVISTYKLSDTKGILQMNEQSLNNGIYFYSILVGEKTIKTDKIVIIK